LKNATNFTPIFHLLDVSKNSKYNCNLILNESNLDILIDETIASEPDSSATDTDRWRVNLLMKWSSRQAEIETGAG